jgi:hypothetical protein
VMKLTPSAGRVTTSVVYGITDPYAETAPTVAVTRSEASIVAVMPVLNAFFQRVKL